MRKLYFTKLICLALLLSVVSCGGNNEGKSSTMSSNSSSNQINPYSWDISAKGNNSVTAEVSEYDGKYDLMITGKGKMKSFKNGVPWSEYVNDITNVMVGEGVTNIGDSAFIGINVDYIYLPSSINSIEDNPANTSTDLLAVSNDIIYSDEITNVYTYVEEDIEVEDRFWISGHTSGDIIPNNYQFDTHKYYWYYDENYEPVTKTKTKILFIGNSFTFQNGLTEYSSGVPGLFNNIAESLGYKCETYMVAGPGWYLESHANEYDSCGKQIDKLLNVCNDFDYIVLQEQSMAPFQNYSKFLNGVKAMQAKIKDTQFNAEIVLYQTWGSPSSASEIGSSIAGMEKQLREGYVNAAQECGITSISPVGKAFTKSYYDNPSIYLWRDDNRHQGYLGAYLSACVHVAHILGGDVRNTTYKGQTNYSDDNYKYVRNVAYEVAISKVEVEYTGYPGDNGNNNNDNDKGPAVSEDVLVIAGWGRFIEEERFNSLIDDFIIYLNENSIVYKEIIGNYYIGKSTSDPYFYIANFSSQIVSDGGADIILPCADNFNANQSNIVALTPFVEIDVYGQTDRRVAMTYEYELSIAFMDYIKSDSAISILTNQTIN